MIEPLRVCRVCGLEAHKESDLKNFVIQPRGKYGRRKLCHKCRNEIRWKIKHEIIKIIPKPKPPYLRKCRECGLEAWTQKDLVLFKKDKRCPYGRALICKRCYNEFNKNYKNPDLIPIHTRRKKELLRVFKERYGDSFSCYFCGEAITKLSGDSSDSLLIHSLDGNHWNWNPDNKVPAHWGCHTKYHLKNRSLKQKLHRLTTHDPTKASNWLGDSASIRTKQARVRRAKKREKRIKELLRQIEDDKNEA